VTKPPGRVGVQVRYSTADLRELMPEMSRHQVRRLKKRCGGGRWLYLSQIRQHDEELWESLALLELVRQTAKSRRTERDDEEAA